MEKQIKKIEKTNEEWKKELDPKTYQVTREAGTEAPFTGKYVDTKEDGTYVCSNCGLELFTSDTKFESGSGWPSFDKPKKTEHVELIPDESLGTTRTEVRCSRCDAHLGHVFPDGPTETGDRYCMNSCSLELKKK